MQMNHVFLLPWLRAARVALRDADLFDQLAEELGYSDHEMITLREALENFLEEGK